MNFVNCIAICTVLLATTAAIANDRIGDDRHGYEAPPLVDCLEVADRVGVAIGADGCLLLSGEARLTVGYDSAADLIGMSSALVSATGVLTTDFGPAFGVVTLLDQRAWPDDAMDIDDEGLSIYEAYAAVGDGVRVVAGRAPSLIKTDDDQALDWLGKYQSDVFFPVQNDGTFPLTANTVQVQTELSKELRVAVGFEEGTHSNDSWGPDLTGRRAVGVVDYDDGQTQGRLTVAGFDVADDGTNWSGRLSLGAAVTDSLRLQAAGSFGDGHELDGMLSVALQLGSIEIAGTVHRQSGYDGMERSVLLSSSITAQVASELALRAGMLQQDSESYDLRQVAVGAVLDVFETAAIDLEYGLVEESGIFDDEGPLVAAYARAKFDWHLSELTKASAATIMTSLGGYKIESQFIIGFR